MRDVGIVYGSKEAAQPLIISKDTVYVHTDIEEVFVEEIGFRGYKYHEIQYDKDEYIQLMSEKSNSLANQLQEVQTSLIETYEQIAALAPEGGQ